MDKTKILFILADALAIFAAIRYTLYLLLLPPLLYLIYIRKKRSPDDLKKREALLISRKILAMLETGGNISTYLAYIGKSEKDPGITNILYLLKRKMLGDLNLHSKNPAKGHIGEIQEMLATHLENGKNISKRLSLFSKRLESFYRGWPYRQPCWLDFRPGPTRRRVISAFANSWIRVIATTAPIRPPASLLTGSLRATEQYFGARNDTII